jgi:hypothetical protein
MECAGGEATRVQAAFGGVDRRASDSIGSGVVLVTEESEAERSIKSN